MFPLEFLPLHDVVLRPFTSYIATMEATQSVTSSLVLPMTGHLLKALEESTPVILYDHEDPTKCLQIKMKVNNMFLILILILIVFYHDLLHVWLG